MKSRIPLETGIVDQNINRPELPDHFGEHGLHFFFEANISAQGDGVAARPTDHVSHALSFAGGPLAAIRNKNPELTRYETAVRGLYLTGAATFPGAGVWGASGRNAATVILAKHS
jgi:phytoene dehydrogenase-like protein